MYMALASVNSPAWTVRCLWHVLLVHSITWQISIKFLTTSLPLLFPRSYEGHYVRAEIGFSEVMKLFVPSASIKLQ